MVEKINFGNNEYVDLLVRNAHMGKESRIIFGSSQLIVPEDEVTIRVDGDMVFIYHNTILIAVVDSRKICAVVCDADV